MVVENVTKFLVLKNINDLVACVVGHVLISAYNYCSDLTGRIKWENGSEDGNYGELDNGLSKGKPDDKLHTLYFRNYTVCPTRHRTRRFFNNFNTNEDIATKFEANYRHVPLRFSHNKRTPVQISLQYFHWR